MGLLSNGENNAGLFAAIAVAEAGKTNLIAGIFGDTAGGLEAAEAHARLIAAAPELLLALEMICESCPLNQELNNITRASLAKARGQ